MLIVINGMAFDHSRILRVVANAANTVCSVYLDTGGVSPAFFFTINGSLAKVLAELESARVNIR